MKTPCSRAISKQSGAALYVAMILLLILSLIGVAGLQVASMQERMSSNYRLTNLAFQRAEAVVRTVEQRMLDQIYAGSGVFAADVLTCDGGYLPIVWSQGLSASTAQAERTRRLDTCFPGGSSLKVGQNQTEQTGNVYQITSYSRDQAVDGTSEAVIDTVFIP